MKSPASYRSLFLKYGPDPKSLKWESRKAAEQRYREIASLLDFKGKSVLDVGCGFGGIIPFIVSKAKTFSYTGIDLIGGFLAEARKLYPQHTFIEGDYFARPLTKKFDIIIANGCLNTNIEDNLGFRKKAIRVMFEHAKKAVVFNMAGGLTPRKTAKGSNVWFADASGILEFCKSLTPEVMFRDHPGRREFTIVLAR